MVAVPSGVSGRARMRRVRLAVAFVYCAVAFAALGLAFRVFESQRPTSEPAAIAFYVDGLPEPLALWQAAVAQAQAQAPAGTAPAKVRLSVFAEARRGLAVLHKAAAQGLAPSSHEVDDLVSSQRSMVLAHADGAARVHRLAMSMGLSDDQYWTRARAGYAQAQAVSRLRTKFAAAHKGTQAGIEGLWQAYEDALSARAVVRMASPTVTSGQAAMPRP